eukprot:jgi/Picsp_1/1211/NSC_04692-R1_carbohydrate kinase-like protein
MDSSKGFNENSSLENGNGPRRIVSISSEINKDDAIGMWKSISKFVPRFLREEILKGPGERRLLRSDDPEDQFAAYANSPTSIDVVGAVSIVDVSGFTAMTSQVAQLGPYGTDLLHHFMNSYFSQLIEIIEQFDGDVVKFAGDAMIVIFLPTEKEGAKNSNEECLRICTARAVECMCQMVRKYGCVVMKDDGSADPNGTIKDELTTAISSGKIGSVDIPSPVSPTSAESENKSSCGHINKVFLNKLNDVLTDIGKEFAVGWDCPYNMPLDGTVLPKDLFSYMTKDEAGKDRDTIKERIQDLVTSSLRSLVAANRLVLRRKVAHPKSQTDDGLLDKMYTTDISSFVHEKFRNFDRTVHLKTMVSCGEMSLVRTGGVYNDSRSSLWEVVLTDKISHFRRSHHSQGTLSSFAEMEHYIEPGQVLVNPRVVHVLDSYIEGHMLKHGYVVVDHLKGTSWKPKNVVSEKQFLLEECCILSMMDLPSCLSALKTLESHVPRTISGVVKLERHGLVSETRLVCTVFLGFPSLLLDFNLNHLQEIFTLVQRKLDETNGGFLQMRFDEKGFVIICGYGLPGHSENGMANKAIKMACEIVTELRGGLGHEAVAGITRGLGFCACIGSEGRTEYSVFDEKVNLAARLMTLAEGGRNRYPVLCDENTYETVANSQDDDWKFEPLPPVPIKGFSSTVQVYAVSRACSSSGLVNRESDLGQYGISFDFFVGKEQEINNLLLMAKDLKETSRGGVVLFTGCHGSGKSALLDEVFCKDRYLETRDLRLVKATPQNLVSTFLNEFLEEADLCDFLGGGKRWIHRWATYVKIDTEELETSLSKLIDGNLLHGFNHIKGLKSTKGQQSNSHEHNIEKVGYALADLCVRNVSRHSKSCVCILDAMQEGNSLHWTIVRRLSNIQSKMLLFVVYRTIQIFSNRAEKTEEGYSLFSLFAVCKLAGPLGDRTELDNIKMNDENQTIVVKSLFYCRHHKDVKQLRMSTFDALTVQQYLGRVFPGLHVDMRAAQFINISLGGLPGALKTLSIYFVKLYQTQWELKFPGTLELVTSAFLHIRLSMESTILGQAIFDKVSREVQTLAKYAALMGPIVRLDLLQAAVPYDIMEQDLMEHLEFLEFLGCLERIKSECICPSWKFQYQYYRMAITDMLSSSQKSIMRGNIALALERLAIDGECSFGLAAWQWKESCRFNEAVQWRRALRAAAAFEDQACIDIAKHNFSNAIKSLSESVRLCRIVRKYYPNNSMIVSYIPKWRIAMWESALSACEISSSDNERPAQSQIIKAFMHCFRAMILLGIPLPWAKYDSSAPNLEATFKAAAQKVLDNLKMPKGFAMENSNAKPLCALESTGCIIKIDNDDDQEDIEGIKGITTVFIPRDGFSDSDEEENERFHLLQILLHIFETLDGKWDTKSIKYLLFTIDHALSNDSSRRKAAAFRVLRSKAVSLSKGGQKRLWRPMTASGWHCGSRSQAYRIVSPVAHVANTEYSDGYPILNYREGEYQDKGIDVLGLGQAMIDFGASVDENWLVALEASKGCRKLISVEERTKILERIADHQYQISAGGSLSNTLIDLARLGNANGGEGSIKVSMAGLVGGDALGAFYKSQMSAAGVSVLASGDENVHTGTVIVLTTEDAQRTMLSYLGTQNEVDIDAVLEDAIQQTSILVIEGYMWELPNSTETIQNAIKIAKKYGVCVAMTAGDAGVVERHSSKIWDCILLGIDIFFTNAEEAAVLARHRPVEIKDRNTNRLGHAATVAEAAALCLSPYCPIVCVTDGSAGSIIASMGQIWVIPPHWNDTPPKDTCGAGDAWAAGLLFGILQGADIVSMGHIAARTASAVIAKHGPTLCPSSAESVVVSKTPVPCQDVQMPSAQQLQSAALPFKMHGYSM